MENILDMAKKPPNLDHAMAAMLPHIAVSAPARG
jgi:hypothetical protein